MEIQGNTSAQLQKEIELAQEHGIEMEARKQMQLEANKVENMSSEKMALMAKYGYEDADADNTDPGGEDSQTQITNRDHANAAALQNAQKQRSTNVQTKKEAREQTAKAKADKKAKLEERRKKAGKKERHR